MELAKELSKSLVHFIDVPECYNSNYIQAKITHDGGIVIKHEDFIALVENGDKVVAKSYMKFGNADLPLGFGFHISDSILKNGNFFYFAYIQSTSVLGVSSMFQINIDVDYPYSDTSDDDFVVIKSEDGDPINSEDERYMERSQVSVDNEAAEEEKICPDAKDVLPTPACDHEAIKTCDLDSPVMIDCWKNFVKDEDKLDIICELTKEIKSLKFANMQMLKKNSEQAAMIENFKKQLDAMNITNSSENKPNEEIEVSIPKPCKAVEGTDEAEELWDATIIDEPQEKSKDPNFELIIPEKVAVRIIAAVENTLPDDTYSDENDAYELDRKIEARTEEVLTMLSASPPKQPESDPSVEKVTINFLENVSSPGNIPCVKKALLKPKEPQRVMRKDFKPKEKEKLKSLTKKVDNKKKERRHSRDVKLLEHLVESGANNKPIQGGLFTLANENFSDIDTNAPEINDGFNEAKDLEVTVTTLTNECNQITQDLEETRSNFKRIVNEKEEEIRKLLDILSKAEEELRCARNDFSNLEITVMKKSNEFHDMLTKYEKVKVENQSLNQALAKADSSMKNLFTENLKLMTEDMNISHKIFQMKNEIMTLTEKIDNLFQENLSLKQQLKEIDAAKGKELLSMQSEFKSRLAAGVDLYKSQYKEIMKLKKKLRDIEVATNDYMENKASTSSTPKSSAHYVSDDEDRFARHLNDSDTGEHLNKFNECGYGPRGGLFHRDVSYSKVPNVFVKRII